MIWSVKEEPRGVRTSADESCWSIPLINEDGRETVVLASISGTAMAMAEEQLPARVAEMRRTKGFSQVEFYLDWEEPPRKVSGTSHWINVELADGSIVQSFGDLELGRAA